MKTFTPEEIVRLNFLYDLLDLSYRGLWEAARIQRAALLQGCLPATVVADTNLVSLSRSVSAAWAGISSILNPAPAPEPAAEPDPDATSEPDPKETIQ